MSNPYRRVHSRIRANQPRTFFWVLPIVAAGLAMPLASPVLLGFLGAGSDAALAPGLEAISFRLGALIAGAMALHTYTDLIRSPDRGVLDPHPIQPRQLLYAVALRTARQRFYLPVMAAVMLLPVGFEGHWLAWAGGTGVALGAWVSALGVGFSTHLGGVWLAWSPRAAAWLDLVRGDNPRLQAALIYAPGVALLVVGIATILAAAGVSSALQGWGAGWAFLMLPPVLGGAGILLAGPLADRHYIRATSLLAEIDAQWAGRESAEDGQRVYLDWLALRRPELLRALRQGWRRLRVWPMGAWLLGVLGLFAGWSDDPGAVSRLVLVASAGGLLICAVPMPMSQGDPTWLDRSLGVNPRKVMLARGLAAWLYAQGVLFPGIIALFIRQGVVSLWALAVVEGMVAVGALLASACAGRWRGRGVWIYGPLGVLFWAAIVGRMP